MKFLDYNLVDININGKKSVLWAIALPRFWKHKANCYISSESSGSRVTWYLTC